MPNALSIAVTIARSLVIEHDIKIMIVHFLLLFAILFNSCVAMADLAQDSTEKSLKLINDFANSMCANPEYRGTSTSAGANVSAGVELSRLLKKLADVKADFAVGARRDEFQGLLQRDLLEATKLASECRFKIFRELKDRLLGNGAQPPAFNQPSAPVSPSFDCIKASNRVERMICSSSRLSILDLAMANAYRDVMAEQRTRENKMAWKDAQNQWRTKVRDQCVDEDSLTFTYMQRLDHLKRARR